MKQWRLHFPVTIMSRVLNVSRSGFYAWLWRNPSRRAQEDELLKVAIKAAHKRTRESYGARRFQPELAADGFVAGRDSIARLRREMGLHCRKKRTFKATTNSKHSVPVAQKRPAAGLIHHSDRGSQYCAHEYRKLLEQFGMMPSMSRKGNCYDNAPMESVWGILENGLVHHCRF